MSCKLETWENGRNACFECIIDGGVGSARAGWRQQSPSRAGRLWEGSRLLLVVMGRRMVMVRIMVRGVVEYDCGDDDDQITMAACE